MDNIKVRKRYGQILDEALEKGKVDMQAVPDGLYLRRLQDELDGAIDIERMKHGVFRATRTEDVLEKVDETVNYSYYRRLNKKWKDLI